jgi:hypothetical protein
LTKGKRTTKPVAPEEDLIKLFEQVQINIPMMDAIRHVPAYARFLKNVCTPKRKSRTKSGSLIILSEQASSVILSKLPPKAKDPGTPLISCKICETQFDRALLDLGDSINLIPTSLLNHLEESEFKLTEVTLQLADRFIKSPKGVLEDVIVRVRDFYFPVDFIVLDMDAPENPRDTPIILGRPFLAIARANISCEEGQIELKFGNQTLKIDIFKVQQGINCGVVEQICDIRAVVD